MTSIHHVNLLSRPGRSEESAEWWQRYFGLARIARPDHDRAGVWLEFSDGRQLHISEREGGPHPDSHLALTVPDALALADDLRRDGQEWIDDAPVFGTPRGFTRDPGGNRVEVISRPLAPRTASPRQDDPGTP